VGIFIFWRKTPFAAVWGAVFRGKGPVLQAVVPEKAGSRGMYTSKKKKLDQKKPKNTF